MWLHDKASMRIASQVSHPFMGEIISVVSKFLTGHSWLKNSGSIIALTRYLFLRKYLNEKYEIYFYEHE